MATRNKSIDGLSAVPKKRQAQMQKQAERRVRSGGGLTPTTGAAADDAVGMVGVVGAQKKRVRKQATEDFLAPVSTFDFDINESDLEADLKKEKQMLKAKKKKKGSKKKKVIIAIVILLLVGAGAGAYMWMNGLLGKISDGNVGIFDFITAKDTELKKDENGRTNILVFGTSGYNMDGDEGTGTHDGAQLTDSIMVISLDQETKDLAMVNLPRDLYVGGTCTATGKVNEVYWCANQDGDDETAGAEALEESVEKIFGLEMHYYVHLNWGTLIDIVDALGGITVTLDESISDSWTKTYIKAGEPTTLNGEQAVGLARARHGTTNGDFTRAASQQKILMALQEKIASEGVSLSEAMTILNSLGDNVRMDFDADEIKTLLNLGEDLSLENLRQVPLTDTDENGTNYVTTGTINGISYVLPVAGKGVYTDIQAYIAKMFSSDPAVREEAKILVLNGSGVSGAAAKEQKKLKSAGFTVPKVGDAPEGIYTSPYYLYDITETMTGTRESLESRYGVSAISATELPEGIYSTGYDFVLIIGQQEETE